MVKPFKTCGFFHKVRYIEARIVNCIYREITGFNSPPPSPPPKKKIISLMIDSVLGLFQKKIPGGGRRPFYFDTTTHGIKFPQTPTTHLIRKVHIPTTHRIKYDVTLAQKVNNSILQTFQERQKTFYLHSLSSHVIAIKCFQMHFLLDFM